MSSPRDAGCVASNRFLTYVARDARIDIRWARWYFLSEPRIEQIRRASPGSADRNRTLSIDRFEALEIPLPPIDVQRRTAEGLDQIVQQVVRVRRETERSRLMMSSIVPSWLESRVSRFGSAHALGDVADIIRGRGPRYEFGTAALVVNQPCVRWDGVDVGQAREVQKSWWLDVSDVGCVSLGDVLVNSTGEGTIGRACVADSSVAGLPFDSHVLVVRCDDSQLIPGYLAAYLRSPAGQAQVEAAKGANTTKQTELGKTKLERLAVPTPPIDDQNRFLADYRRLLTKVNGLREISTVRSERVEAVVPATFNASFGQLI